MKRCTKSDTPKIATHLLKVIRSLGMKNGFMVRTIDDCTELQKSIIFDELTYTLYYRAKFKYDNAGKMTFDINVTVSNNESPPLTYTFEENIVEFDVPSAYSLKSKYFVFKNQVFYDIFNKLVCGALIERLLDIKRTQLLDKFTKSIDIIPTNIPRNIKRDRKKMQQYMNNLLENRRKIPLLDASMMTTVPIQDS